MRIGVIGSGRIGGTLGGLWAKAGHEVMFSDRDPEQAKRAAEGAGANSAAAFCLPRRRNHSNATLKSSRPTVRARGRGLWFMG